MIQKQLIDRLALKVLEGEFTEGDRIVVDLDGDELTFTKSKKPSKAEAEPAAA